MQAHEDDWAHALRAERRGDRVAYERFLAELAQALRGIVRHRLGPAGPGGDEIEDVVQEVLIAVHERRRQWDPTRPLLPWLNAIVRYKAIDALRRMHRHRLRHVPMDDEAWALLPGAPASDAGTPSDVERLLAQLPAGQQSVVRAVGVDGASHGEAAARLGISEGAVRVAFHRGLKRLLQAARIGNRE